MLQIVYTKWLVVSSAVTGHFHRAQVPERSSNPVMCFHFSIGNLCQSVMMDLKSTFIERATAMPTRNVNLTHELDRFVAKKVKTGRYENASEVVRAGLRSLEREEQEYEAKLAGLRAAIDEGDASGIAEGNVFGRVRKSLKLPVS